MRSFVSTYLLRSSTAPNPIKFDTKEIKCMKIKIHSKVLSILIVLSILLTSLVLPATALDNTSISDIDSFETSNNLFAIPEVTPADNIFLTSSEMISSEDKLMLKYIDVDYFDTAKHSARLVEHEDLNTFVFQNTDGTRTVYIMEDDVKYIDTKGEVKIKDLTLVKNNNGYGIGQSDISLLIPDKLDSGVSVDYDNYSVQLIPQNVTRGTSAEKVDNSVVYNGVFGDKTSLKYTPILSGLKEDIILSDYVGNASYTFILRTNGLKLENRNGKYVLSAGNDKDPVYYLGDIIVYDAIGKPDVGEMNIVTVKENHEYLLSISVDDDFLSDPSTVYPVTIDPSITKSDSSVSGSIEDAPIFEGKPNINFGTYVYNRVGTPSESYGVGRTVVRLRGLLDSTEYLTVDADHIQSVEFYVTESSGGATHTVNIYPLMNSTWTELGVTWSNIGNYNNTLICSSTLTNNAQSVFDITALVKGWKNEVYSEEAGFIMLNADESLNKSFCSSEFSTETKKPKVIMTYSTDLSIDRTQVSIPEGGSHTLVATTKPAGQTVTWSSGNASIATVNTSGKVTGIRSGTTIVTATMTDSDGVTHTETCEVNVYIPSGVYRLKNVDNGLYLDVTGGGYTAGTEMQQWSRATSDTNRAQLFKIVYLGTYGGTNLNYYCIRSMTNSALGVYAPYYSNGENVTLESITTDDSWYDISYEQSWAISRYGTSDVTIRNGPESYSSYLATPENSVKGERVLTTSTVSTNSRWILELYDDVPLQGVLWSSFDSTLAVGESYSYKAIMYDEDIGDNGPVTYSVANIDGSTTDKATINPTTGALTAQRTGQIRVRITYEGAPSVWYSIVTIDGYVSADLAAMAFATEIYAASLYIRHEFSTEIYKVTENGKTLYYYTEPAAGSPHSASGIDMNRVPENGTAVAYSHTHPNSNSFSTGDINYADYYYIDAYFNGPNVNVNKYDQSTGNYPIFVGTITPDPLTEAEKLALVEEFHDSWYNHIVDGKCEKGFNCANIVWPTQ